MRSVPLHAVFVCALVGLTANSQAQDSGSAEPKLGSAPPTITSTVDMEANAGTWRGSRGVDASKPVRGHGEQLYSAARFGTLIEWDEKMKWELSARGGYASTRHGTPDQKANVDTFVDTQLTSTVTLLSMPMWQPFFGLAANLPTGESYLPGVRRFARFDPDLSPIGSYGEGFTLTPSFGFNTAPTAGIVITPTVSYGYRRSFYRDGFDALTEIHNARNKVSPGDLMTGALNSSIQHDKWTVDLTGSYSVSGTSKTDGVPQSRTGGVIITNARVQYNFTDQFSIAVDGSWNYTLRNTQRENDIMVRESKNSNSQLYVMSVRPQLVLTDKLTTHISYGYMHRDKNFYDIFSSSYVPPKNKHTLGTGFDYALTNETSLSVKGARIWVKELPTASRDELGVETRNPAREYTGWQGTAAITQRF